VMQGLRLKILHKQQLSNSAGLFLMPSKTILRQTVAQIFVGSTRSAATTTRQENLHVIDHHLTIFVHRMLYDSFFELAFSA